MNRARDVHISVKLLSAIASLVLITKKSIVKGTTIPPPPIPATLFKAAIIAKTITPAISSL